MLNAPEVAPAFGVGFAELEGEPKEESRISNGCCRSEEREGELTEGVERHRRSTLRCPNQRDTYTTANDSITQNKGSFVSTDILVP